MPIKITAWACQFKCGKKVQTVRERMERHEAFCFRNPATRSCIICKYFDGGNGWEEPLCEIEKLGKKHPKNPHGLRTHCEHWKVNV